MNGQTNQSARITDELVQRATIAMRLVAAQCSVCHVAYVEGYEGPCQEPAGFLTDAQLEAGDTRTCPGYVTVQYEDMARAALSTALDEGQS